MSLLGYDTRFMEALRCCNKNCTGAVIGQPARCCTCGASFNKDGDGNVIAYVVRLQSSVAAACSKGQLVRAEQQLKELERLLHPFNRYLARAFDDVARVFAEGVSPSVSRCCATIVA